jgi:hypothetical protein
MRRNTAVLFGKNGCRKASVFPFYEPAETEQRETLRRLICCFWYDLSHHFITPLTRKQFWLAYGA